MQEYEECVVPGRQCDGKSVRSLRNFRRYRRFCKSVALVFRREKFIFDADVSGKDHLVKSRFRLFRISALTDADGAVRRDDERFFKNFLDFPGMDVVKIDDKFSGNTLPCIVDGGKKNIVSLSGGGDQDRRIKVSRRIMQRFPIAVEWQFKRYLDTTPIRYLIRTRMDFAAELLKRTDDPIKEISEQCGFSDQLYFSAVFKKYFNCSPRDYRRNRENETADK